MFLNAIQQFEFTETLSAFHSLTSDRLRLMKKNFIHSFAWIIFVFLSLSARAFAADVSAPSVRTAEFGPVTDSGLLKPGQFEWQPELSVEGEVSMNVDLSKQILEVWRGGVLIARSSVSSGRSQSTPNGTFNILQKRVEHHSSLYKGAPMPYMQRLSWEGIAIHSGYLPGVPASHGCIRVPNAFAKRLFQITSYGNTVTIYGNSKDFRPHWARAIRNPVQESSPQTRSASVTLPTVKNQSMPSSNPETSAGVRADPVVAKGRKSMRELEIEELRIRNDTQLTQVDRIKELKRVWGDQRALTEGGLMGVASKSQ